jgi:hypothetical protein
VERHPGRSYKVRVSEHYFAHALPHVQPKTHALSGTG